MVDEEGGLPGRTPDPEGQGKCTVEVERNVDVQFAEESLEGSNMWLLEGAAGPEGILWVLVVVMVVQQPSQVEEVVLPLRLWVEAAVLTPEISLELELSLPVQVASEEYAAHESEGVESEAAA